MQIDYINDRDALLVLLQKHVSGDRLQHSLNVEAEALKLAECYGADCGKAGMAGLLHDITKQMDNIALAQKYSIASIAEKTLHARTAACWLKEQGIVEDEEILCAIKYHTTGREDMTLLEKIIYVADYIEPLRDFEEAEELRRYAYTDIDKAVMFELSIAMKSVLDKGGAIDSSSVSAYNCYREKR